MPKLRRTNIYLTAKQHQQLTAIAKKTGVRLSELVRQAIDQVIEDAAGAKPQTRIWQAVHMFSDESFQEWAKRSVKRDKER